MQIRTMGVAILMSVGWSMAQDRLPPIPADKMTDAQKKAAADYQAMRGVEINGPFIALNRSPELMTLTASLGTYLRFKSSLPHAVNEFVILMGARHYSSSYEWSIHQPIALAAGVKPEIAEAIHDGRRPTGMSADQEAAWDFVDELLHHFAVSDLTYARALKQFGEQGVVDLIGVTGYYSYIAMTLNTARKQLDTPNAPTLQPLVAPVR
jgi:4-carboxymuconolactone decarboxylase